MKKLIPRLFLLLALGAMLVSGSIPAATDGTITPTAEDAAQLLFELGLLRGTDNGFELEREMTRGEAAAMLVRFLGQEAAALETVEPHPFSDVPDWASPYVGWLYANGLTNGTGSQTYSPQSSITYEHYALFLTRITEKAWDGGLATGIYFYYYPNWVFGNSGDYYPVSEEHNRRLPLPISRGDAAILSAFALRTYDREQELTIAEILLAGGVFAEEQLCHTADRVYGTGFTKEALLVSRHEIPLDYLDVTLEKSPFSYIGGTLYYTNDGVRNQLLAPPEDEPKRQYYITPKAEGQAYITVSINKDEAFEMYFFEAEGCTLYKLNLPENASPFSYPMRLSTDDHVYMGGNGLFKAGLRDGSLEQIHGYPVAQESASGICMGPEGVVSILADNRLLYVTESGAEIEIFPNLWGNYLRWGVWLNSYDGETLEFVYPYSVEQSMGGHSTGFYCTIRATGDTLVCIDCVRLNDGVYVGEMDEETKTQIIAAMQKLIDSGEFPRA